MIKDGEKFLFEFQNFNKIKINVDQFINKNFQEHIRSYQLDGIKWISFLFKYNLSGALCDDMGLGKTI